MSRLGHLTEHRKHFVKAYCRLGNGTLAAKEAGYKDSPSLVNQASKLKRTLCRDLGGVKVIIHECSTQGVVNPHGSCLKLRIRQCKISGF